MNPPEELDEYDEAEPAPLGPYPKGPFVPPDDYLFEDELQGEPPRPRTPELRRGRHAVGQRSAVSGLLIAGGLLTSSGQLPIVQRWGLYLLPLQYLTWIGVACGLFGVIAFLSHRVRRGPYRYVEEGIPLPVRIRSLDLRPTVIVNTQPSTYRFFATIEFRDPESGHLKVFETSSNDIASASKDQLTTTYRVGDYATAVYLPGTLDKTLRLYGFLDLKPGLGLIRRDAASEGSVLKSALLLVAIFGLFAALFWNVYAYGKYAPIALTARQGAPPFVVGAVVLGGGLLASLVREQSRLRARRVVRNAEALARGGAIEPESSKGWFGDHGVFMGLVIVAGSILIGGLTMLCWAFSANALLDTSKAVYRPAQIQRMVAVTHKMLFREYKIEYHFVGEPEKRDCLSTPSEMARFQHDLALAEVHRGRFGWAWVKALHPIPVARDPGPGPR